MKFFALLAFVFSANLYCNDIFNLVSEYRKNGVSGIKDKLESYLTTRQYWENHIANIDTKFGYFEGIKYIFVASKKSANLALYKLENNKLNLINQTSALFGSNLNDKRFEGDKATPIGAYNLTQKLQNLDQYYGPLAFSTAYPNIYDKLQKKTGGGIWIHGLPLNGNRDERATKGCIAIENATLEAYERAIDYKDSILLTYADSPIEAQKSHIAAILEGLFIWRDAWINNDLKKYLSFYSKDFRRFDGMNLAQFSEFKRRVFDKNERKNIDFDDINIAPYPNTANLAMYRIDFLEDYKAQGGYKFKGTKELYVLINNDKMEILVEK